MAWIPTVEALKRMFNPVSDHDASAPAVSINAANAPSCSAPAPSAWAGANGMVSTDSPPCAALTRIPSRPMYDACTNRSAFLIFSPSLAATAVCRRWRPAAAGFAARSQARKVTRPAAMRLPAAVRTSTWLYAISWPRRSTSAVATTSSPIAAAR
ncbi:MAG: hypothetical protein U0802_17030 [Candidatus Binatia bacterium]